jgi:hypothetical protein
MKGKVRRSSPGQSARHAELAFLSKEPGLVPLMWTIASLPPQTQRVLNRFLRGVPRDHVEATIEARQRLTLAVASRRIPKRKP